MKAIRRSRKDIAGELNPKAKLSELDVKEIKARADAGEAYAAIARSFGVEASIISRIHRGKRWEKNIGYR